MPELFYKDFKIVCKVAPLEEGADVPEKSEVIALFTFRPPISVCGFLDLFGLSFVNQSVRRR